MPDSFEPLPATDLPRLEGLLRTSGLTSDGLDAGHVRLMAMWREGMPIACAALELLGPVGLLRSVAVTPALRGTGLGRRIVAAVEQSARDEGIRKLYLLTETAEHFFGSIGYRPERREEVPEPVRRTGQFTTLCPESAVVMTRDLDHID